MRSVVGTGRYAMPMHRAGTAGRGAGGNVGALGLEVNLFKLGGYGDGLPRSYTSIEPIAPSWPMLGDADVVADYGLAARRAASDAQRSEMRNRLFDQQDAARRAEERERAILLSQQALDQATVTQEKILTAGSENLTKVMRGTTAVGIIALGAFAVTAIFSNLGKKNRDIEDWEHQRKHKSMSGGSRSRSRYSPRRSFSRRKRYSPKPFSPTSQAGPTRFSPIYGDDA